MSNSKSTEEFLNKLWLIVDDTQKARKLEQLFNQELDRRVEETRQDEASHYCDEGHYHDNTRGIAMLPSERIAELSQPKENK